MDATSLFFQMQGIQAAQAAADQSKLTNNIAQQQLDWGKQQWAADRARSQPIIDAMIAGQNQANEFGRQNQDFFNNTYSPLLKDFADQAKKYNSQDYQELRAGQAGAAVAQNFAGAKAAAEQNLKDFGVDPSSPRYASTNLLNHIGQATATAGAENTERANVQSEGLALEQQAIGNGFGVAGLANQSYNTGLNAGNSAVNNTLANTASGASIMGTAPQYYGLSNNALNTWGSLANNNYSNYMQGYQADQARAGARTNAIGSALGLAGGIGVQAAMGRFFPTPAVPHQAAGGTVPDQASPTDGAAVDDVPAQLTAGEFVIPKSAVEWFGQKHFHQLIDKANKERQQMTAQSGAVPEMGPGSDQPPAFVSRSQPQAALPVG
jgi:hypothetical protein